MMQQHPKLLGMSLEELESFAVEIGQQKYRGRQLAEWLYHQAAVDFDEMSNLSMALRQELSAKAELGALSLVTKQESHQDPVSKFLFSLYDGQRVESVLMRYNYGNSVCVSSQVGCKMACSFCASGKSGFGRNLDAGEMIGQVLAIHRDLGQRISHIVLMGMGEPLDNLPNVIKFLQLANAPWGLGIGYRHITLSTSGLVPQINELAEYGLPITLSISLHAPNDQIRNELMPISKKYGISQLLAACNAYVKKTGRRITFEYALIRGVNDRAEHARELAKRLAGMLCHVNLIPINNVVENRYQRSNKQDVQNFAKVLEESGVETTIRREMGSDIDAACGQLRRRELSENVTL